MKSKKYIIEYLHDKLVEANDSKYLKGRSKIAYFRYFRDRREENTYYLINIKGNYIRAYTIRYEYADKTGINLFFTGLLKSLRAGKNIEVMKIKPIIITHKELIVKKKIADYQKFSQEFRQKASTLHWHSEDDL